MEAGGAVGNGGFNHEQVILAPNGVAPAQSARAANALFLVFLRFPAQEVARFRCVCRLWRDVTITEAFRRRHSEHYYRMPMPLFFFQDPDLVRVNLRARAVDIGYRVSRPVFRFTRPPSHEVFRIHGSCGGILLLSSGDGLYACNPCTRRWAHLPPLHVDHDIVGFYVTGVYHGEFRCHVLYHDRNEPDCAYWIFTLAAAALQPLRIGRPGDDDDRLGLDLVLAKGILPSYKIPPVFLANNILHWLPQAAQDNSNVIIFDAFLRSFALIPPPTIRVNNEDVPAVGGQLFEINERLAMTVISRARADVWVRNTVTGLWDFDYRIPLPVDDINLNDGYFHHDGTCTLAAGVFAVAQDQNVARASCCTATPWGSCSGLTSLLNTGLSSPDTRLKRASFCTPPFSRCRTEMMMLVTRPSSKNTSSVNLVLKLLATLSTFSGSMMLLKLTLMMLLNL
jgi:hypothetical protein